MFLSKTVLGRRRLEIFVDRGKNQRLQDFRSRAEKRDFCRLCSQMRFWMSLFSLSSSGEVRSSHLFGSRWKLRQKIR